MQIQNNLNKLNNLGSDPELFVNYLATDIGSLGIVEKDGMIVRIDLPGDTRLQGCTETLTPTLEEARRQLQEYFQGRRKKFALPLAMSGSEFMLKVWRGLLTIPYGETRSYGDIARLIGNKNASRAVGMANHRNPIAIVVPCHRVIGADGKLVGYGGGLKTKAYLLELEKYYSSFD